MAGNGPIVGSGASVGTYLGAPAHPLKVFNAEGVEVLRIEHNGAIILGEGVTPTDAARELIRVFPGVYQEAAQVEIELRTTEILNANSHLSRCRNCEEHVQRHNNKTGKCLFAPTNFVPDILFDADGKDLF